ncbi:MAG: PAS domain S-box protein [Desulfovibrionaceae bacterium]|nr:PAS domain S-box protein [Desulfovibrionaceae bacterium]
MNDQRKTKRQLIQELEALRRELDAQTPAAGPAKGPGPLTCDPGQLFRSFMNNSVSAIFATDRQGRLIIVNKVAEALLGKPECEVVGKSPADLFPRDQADTHWADKQRVMDTGRPMRKEEVFALNGERRTFLTSLFPLCGQDNEILGVGGISTDITERKKTQDDLEKLKTAVEQTIDGIAMADLDGTLTFLNKAFAKMHGFEHAQGLLGRHLSIFHTPEQLENEVLPFKRKSVEHGAHSGEIWHKRVDGSLFPTHMTSSLIRDERGEPMGLVTVAQDITEGKGLREELQKAHDRLEIRVKKRTQELEEANSRLRAEYQERLQAEARYQELFNNAPIGVFQADLDGRILNVNAEGAKMLGYSSPEELMRGLARGGEQEHACLQRLIQGFRLALDTGELKNFDYLSRKKNGDLIWICANVRKTLDGHSKRRYLDAFCSDVTERKKAEEHVQTLGRELLTAQETERQRMARELHDNVAQDLSSLKIAFGTLLDDQPKASATVAKRLANISSLLEKAIRSIRDLAYGLHPSGLERLGLAGALSKHCRDASAANAIPIEISCAGLDGLRLASNTEINLFRLAQEALNNAVRHSKAERINVRVAASFPNILLRIEDNGIGFDVRKRPAEALREQRMGLKNMRERVGLLGGDLEIRSLKGRGTLLTISVPYMGA